MNMVADTRIPVPRFCDAAHKAQIDALRAFDEGRARFAHLIWHRRGRKSTLALNLMIRECVLHPNHTYRHILPSRVQAKEAIWSDPNMLFSYLPPQNVIAWSKNESDLTIRFPNGSRYVLDGADKLADARRSIGGHGFVLDEWAFHASNYVYVGLIQPILAEGEGRWCWKISTYNGQNHAYEDVQAALREKGPDTYVSILKASESGVLAASELALAKKKMPLMLYLQEMECEPVSASEMVLIQIGMVERLKGIHHMPKEIRRIVSCDPAFGGDACIVMGMENGRIVEKVELHPTNTDEIVGACMMVAGRLNTHNFIIDTIGWGKGATDGLMQIGGNHVQAWNCAESPSNPDAGPCLLANKRSEMWWATMEAVNAGTVPYIEDDSTRKQLTSICYRRTSRGAIMMELKDDVRKRLGRSPDEADAYVMGVYGQANVSPVVGGVEQYRRFIPAAARMGSMSA